MVKCLTSAQAIYVILLSVLCGLKVYGADTLDCDFEDGLCNWRQDTAKDHFNWTRHTGPTPTEGTGPNGDHTSGDGFFVYIDTSEVNNNTKAWLISPVQDLGTYCLSLWFFMYGQQVHKLKVFKSYNGWSKLFEISRNQGQSWKIKQYNITADTKFTIVIEGKVRNNNNHDRGDIAIDDIVMFSGPCPTGCDDPTPAFGVVNSEVFGIGSVVEVTCKTGYIIEGISSVDCLANGTWSDRPKCIPIDCGDPTPSSGSSNSTNFQYRSVIAIKCVSGYKIKGTPSIICQANGYWSSKPVCEPIDCSMPIIPQGNTSTIEGDSTYNSSVMLDCADGYTLIGNRIVTCQADGNWTTLPKCHIQEPENNTLMIVYVVVPIAVIALFAGLFCIIRRKMHLKCITTQFSNRKDVKKCKPHPGYNFTNKSHSRHNTEPSSGIELPPPPDTEHVVVTDDRNRNENEDVSIYYNTADATLKGQADDDHDYDHTKTVAFQCFDNTYSHASGNKSNYNTTMFSCYSNEAFQTDTQDENDNYDILNVTDPKQISAKELTLDMQDDQDPAYDHAKAGGVDPVDLDDYLHLNDTKTKPTDITLNGLDGSEYVNANEISTREAKVCDRNNASQKQQSGSPSQTFICKAETQHTTEDERNYFVLEKEEKDCGQSDSNELNDHEYFVLEKMET